MRCWKKIKLPKKRCLAKIEIVGDYLKIYTAKTDRDFEKNDYWRSLYFSQSLPPKDNINL